MEGEEVNPGITGLERNAGVFGGGIFEIGLKVVGGVFIAEATDSFFDNGGVDIFGGRGGGWRGVQEDDERNNQEEKDKFKK